MFRCTCLLIGLLASSCADLLAQDSTLWAKADTLFAHQEWRSARKAYQRLLEEDHPSAHVYYRLAICDRQLGAKSDEVFGSLADALRLDPCHVQALLFRGQRYFDLMMFERSIDDLTQAISCSPGNDTLAYCYYSRGTSRLASRYFDTAEQDLLHAIALDSTCEEAYNSLAYVYHFSGRRAEALVMQERYTQLVPNDHTGYMNLGFYLSDDGHYQEAMEWYLKAREHGGEEHFEWWNNVGFAKFKLGDTTGALKDIRKSLELRSWNSYAYRNLALVEIARGKTDEACEALENALKWGFTGQYGDEVQRLYDEHCR